MNIEEIIIQKEGFKKQFYLSDKQFDALISYLKENDEPKYNAAIVIKLNNSVDHDKDNTVHVTQFFHDALNHARNDSI